MDHSVFHLIRNQMCQQTYKRNFICMMLLRCSRVHCFLFEIQFDNSLLIKKYYNIDIVKTYQAPSCLCKKQKKSSTKGVHIIVLHVT